MSRGDVASFDDVVSSDPATLVIGTGPGEWVRERDRLRFGFEAEGARIDPGSVVAYEEGTLAWAVDEPTMYFPGDVVVKVRLTAVFHDEGGVWKLVHMHTSAGVPDEEVTELQRRWLQKSGGRA
jgi:hypothetical protein